MKKFIIVLIVLIVADLSVTYYVGKQAEKAYNRTITLLNNTPGIQARVVSFQRGFFSSYAESEIFVGKDSYYLQDTLYHGPIAINFKHLNKSRMALGVVQSNIQTASFSTPVEATVVFPFSGGAVFSSTGSTFQFKDQSVLLIEGTGWDAKGAVNSQFDTYHFQNLIPYISIMSRALGDRDKTEIKDMKVSLDYKKKDTTGDLKVAYTIASIANTAQSFELINLNLEGGLLLRAESFDTTLQAKLDKLVLKEDNIGPSTLNLKIENVDIAFFELAKKLGLGKPVTAKEMQDVIKIVLKRGFLIKVDDIEAKYNQGQIVLKGKLMLGGPDFKEPITQESVVAASEGDIYVSMPKTILRDLLKNNVSLKLSKDPAFKMLPPAEQQQKIDAEITRIIDNLKNSQIMTETDQAYIIKFSFSKGRYIVEGKEVQKPDI